MPNLEYETEPLDEMEDVLGVFYGGRGQVGQQYVVTNRRLLMGPLDSGMVLEIDAYVASQAVPGGGDLLKNVLSHYAPMNPKTLWLRHVVDVESTNNARLLKPPGLQITTDTQQVFNLVWGTQIRLRCKSHGFESRPSLRTPHAPQAAWLAT